MVQRKSIFITGAASGIGRATALFFAHKGWFVGLYDTNEGGLKEVYDQIGPDRACYGKLDVTSVQQVKQALEHFTSRTQGKMNVLFNCAGALKTGCFESIPFRAHEIITDVNTKGVLICAYHAFPWLKDTQGATVVSMSSASAIYGTPEYATYSASKFWIRGFTEALNIEWAPYGIHVLDIMTPFVRTPLLDGDNAGAIRSLGVKLTPEDLARQVWKAIHSRKVHWLVSVFFWFNWTVARRLPDWMGKMIVKRVCGY